MLNPVDKQGNEQLPWVILLATAGQRESLETTLQSLAACELPERFFGTYLVENGTPESRLGEVAEKAPAKLCARLLHRTRGNKSAALNYAMETIFAEVGDAWVFMTDDDARFVPELFRRYEAAVADAPEGRFFGGAILPVFEAPPPPWFVRLGPPSVRGYDLGPRAGDVIGATFIGPNWVARLRDLRECQFPEDRGPGTKATGQETGMMDRLVRRGAIPYWVPGIPVEHHIPKSVCTVPWLENRARRMGYSRSIYWGEAGKNGAWATLRAYIAIAVFALRGLLAKLTKNEMEVARSRYAVSLRRGYLEGLREGSGPPARP
jgi:L-malate glycosyltransferase